MKYRKRNGIYIPQTDIPAGVRCLGRVNRPGGSDIQLYASESAIAQYGDGTGSPTAFWYASFKDWYDFRRELLMREKFTAPIELVSGEVVLLTERVLEVDRGRLIGCGYFELLEQGELMA